MNKIFILYCLAFFAPVGIALFSYFLFRKYNSIANDKIVRTIPNIFVNSFDDNKEDKIDEEEIKDESNIVYNNDPLKDGEMDPKVREAFKEVTREIRRAHGIKNIDYHTPNHQNEGKVYNTQQDNISDLNLEDDLSENPYKKSFDYVIKELKDINIEINRLQECYTSSSDKESDKISKPKKAKKKSKIRTTNKKKHKEKVRKENESITPR
jgi:hypothetical protein